MPTIAFKKLGNKVAIQVFGTVHCSLMMKRIQSVFIVSLTDQCANMIPDNQDSGVIENVSLSELGYDRCDTIIEPELRG